jgi:hypothetical protein
VGPVDFGDLGPARVQPAHIGPDGLPVDVLIVSEENDPYLGVDQGCTTVIQSLRQ